MRDGMLTDCKAIGERIRGHRQALRLSQRALARRVGVSVSFIGMLERGEKLPSLNTAALLSEALDCTIDDFVTGTERGCTERACPLRRDLLRLLLERGPRVPDECRN